MTDSPSIMRRGRRRALGVAALALLAAAGVVGTKRALGTCEVFDRLLGRSGCVASRFVADYRPLGFHTMTPAGGTTMRLFGFAGRGGEARSVQVALDWATGRETAREPLPLGALGFLIRASRDGTSVAAICTANDNCDRRRPQGYVFDAASGAVREELVTASYVDWSFPGERPSGPIGFEAAVAAGGELLADLDPETGGLRLRRLDRRAEVARLRPPDPYRPGPLGPLTIAARASPSGRFVALLDNRRLYPDGGTRVDVWDVVERRLVGSLVTDAGHRLDTNAAWSADERHLAAFRDWSDTTPGERAGERQRALRLPAAVSPTLRERNRWRGNGLRPAAPRVSTSSRLTGDRNERRRRTRSHSRTSRRRTADFAPSGLRPFAESAADVAIPRPRPHKRTRDTRARDRTHVHCMNLGLHR